MISNVKNLITNVKRMTDGLSAHQVYTRYGVSVGVHNKVVKGNIDGVAIPVIAKYARRERIGISELFISQEEFGKYHEWYGNTEPDYLCENLREILLSQNISYGDMGTLVNKSKATISSYVVGNTSPPLGALQEIADKLEVEVADLFLPLEV